MRCRAGELAFYVGVDPACYGRVVQCIEIHALATSLRGAPYWVTEPSLPLNDGSGRFSLALADASLRPIRDPGEDATDEIVALVGAPATEPARFRFAEVSDSVPAEVCAVGHGDQK